MVQFLSKVHLFEEPPPENCMLELNFRWILFQEYNPASFHVNAPFIGSLSHDRFLQGASVLGLYIPGASVVIGPGTGVVSLYIPGASVVIGPGTGVVSLYLGLVLL